MNLDKIIAYSNERPELPVGRFDFYPTDGGIYVVTTLEQLFAFCRTHQALKKVRCWRDSVDIWKEFTAADLATPEPALLDNNAAGDDARGTFGVPLAAVTTEAIANDCNARADYENLKCVAVADGPVIDVFRAVRFAGGKMVATNVRLLSFNRVNDFDSLSDREFADMVFLQMKGVGDGEKPVDTDRPAATQELRNLVFECRNRWREHVDFWIDADGNFGVYRKGDILKPMRTFIAPGVPIGDLAKLVESDVEELIARFETEADTRRVQLPAEPEVRPDHADEPEILPMTPGQFRGSQPMGSMTMREYVAMSIYHGIISNPNRHTAPTSGFLDDVDRYASDFLEMAARWNK